MSEDILKKAFEHAFKDEYELLETITELESIIDKLERENLAINHQAGHDIFDLNEKLTLAISALEKIAKPEVPLIKMTPKELLEFIVMHNQSEARECLTKIKGGKDE